MSNGKRGFASMDVTTSPQLARPGRTNGGYGSHNSAPKISSETNWPAIFGAFVILGAAGYAKSMATDSKEYLPPFQESHYRPSPHHQTKTVPGVGHIATLRH